MSLPSATNPNSNACIGGGDSSVENSCALIWPFPQGVAVMLLLQAQGLLLTVVTLQTIGQQVHKTRVAHAERVLL